jgi:hypothetical protein
VRGLNNFSRGNEGLTKKNNNCSSQTLGKGENNHEETNDAHIDIEPPAATAKWPTGG